MNMGAFTDRERRLAQLHYIVLLPYEEKKDALRLIQRGIDETLLHFWYNVYQGHYKNLPQAVLERDIQRMCDTYPQFADDIKTWASNTTTP